VGSYRYVCPFQCRPRQSIRTCILPPPRTTGTYPGVSPSRSAQHCFTRALCSSRPSQPGTWNAPGASSVTIDDDFKFGIPPYSYATMVALPAMLKRSVLFGSSTARPGLSVPLLAVLAMFAGAKPAQAHPVPFSYLDVHIAPDALEVSVVAHI